jgi:1-acyl-sn-glycerol-3-phosphate acyltransferase
MLDSIIRYIAYLFLRALFRLEIKNCHYIPEKGGVIIASNHTSYLDPPVLAASLKRRPTFIAKSSLYKIPIVGFIIKAYSIGVKRDMPGPSTIKKALKVLKSGGALVIFPEGGRSKEGKLMEFKRGVGLLAALGNVPVIPAYIKGAHRALPVGAKLIRMEKIKIIFGRPIIRRSGEDDLTYENRVTKEIFDEIKRLSQT